MGTLYLVATPIGNLEDISARALRILSSVRLIAAEDTRQTLKLATHFSLHAPLISYYEHNKISRLDQILRALEEGDVALVSDAGTPALNDPGYELVCAALERGIPVCPIPGACAPVTALVASGLPTDSFLYLGYLPRKSRERRLKLAEIASLPHTLLFLESPHRLLEALADLHTVLGERRICVGREMTKVHEEFFRGSLSEAEAHFRQQTPRGEFTLVLAGAPLHLEEAWTEAEVRSALNARLETGESLSSAASALAQESGWKKREIYRLGLDEGQD